MKNIDYMWEQEIYRRCDEEDEKLLEDAEREETCKNTWPKKNHLQPAKFAEVNNLSPMEYCVIKRMCRWRRGGKGIEDLQKAQSEIGILLKLVEDGDIVLKP